jgi:polar amino acid transport system substrate-binding protein
VLTACTSTARTAPSTTTVPEPTTRATTTTLAASGDGLMTRVKGVLTVATELPAPPFYVADANGDIIAGFEYDLARAIGARLHVPAVQVVTAPLLTLVTGQDCRCDVMLSQVTITDQRAQRVDFTEPYLVADHAALVRTGTVLTTMADARLLRWGITLDDDAGRAVLRRIDPAPAAATFLDHADALRALAAGQIDGILTDAPLAIAAAAANPALAVPARFDTGERYAAVLRLGSPDTALINDVIASLERDGVIGLLARRYFGTDPAALPVLPGS